MSSLSKLKLPTKEVEITYPGTKAVFTIAYCGREIAAKLTKKATVTSLKRGQSVSELDHELFNKLFVEHCIRGWKGLTREDISSLMLVDFSELEGGLDTEWPYSPEDAVELVSSSSSFDSWLQEVVFDLDNFRTRAEIKAD